MSFLKHLLPLGLSVALAASLSQPTFAFKTANGNIYDNAGNQVSINGVAWIGFQDSNFLGGLWNTPFNPIGSTPGIIQLLTAPWTVSGSNITSQTSGVSFKSLRLPIQPGIWHNVTTVQQSPFDFSSTNSATPTAGNGPFCDWTQGADGSGHCIASKSAPDLLTATINLFQAQNINIMLDFHHRPGLGDNFRDGTVVASDYTLQNYHDDVANFVKGAPSNIMGVDLYNEPHQLFWYQDNTQTTPVQPAWIKVIAAAASAVYDNNQNVLLFVEAPGGTVGNDPYDPAYNQTTPICLPASTKIDSTTAVSVTTDTVNCPASNPLRVTNIGSNWGENLRPLLDTSQSKNGVAKFNVTQFRSMLIQAITTNNFSSTDPNLIADWLLGPNNDGNNGHLVFAPHLYGSQVAGWQSDANDSQIRFKWNFGFTLDSGFPFVVGELGFDVQEPQTGGEDFFLNSVAPYLVSKGINHNLFFWTWNFSDSPAGIRSNDSGYTLFAWKEQDLYNLFNAIPPVLTYGTLCVTVPTPTGYTGTALPTITANGPNNYTFSIASFGTPVCNSNVVTGSYTLSGTTLTDSSTGLVYSPSQNVTASVTQSTETDSTVAYAQQPTGSLSLSVTGDTTCAITSTQQFTVTYSMGSTSKQTTVTTAAPVTINNLPVGSYTINVSPDPLTSNQQCKAQYATSVAVTANQTAAEAINYTFTPAGACTVNAQCSTWGTPSDSWSGSSCNFFLNVQSGMTAPTTFTLNASGISAVTQAWGATATFQNGTVVMTLTDPVYNTNIGFNANGVITLPSQVTINTKGQTLVCPLVQQ